jgi:hypothetical protein
MRLKKLCAYMGVHVRICMLQMCIYTYMYLTGACEYIFDPKHAGFSVLSLSSWIHTHERFAGQTPHVDLTTKTLSFSANSTFWKYALISL